MSLTVGQLYGQVQGFLPKNQPARGILDAVNDAVRAVHRRYDGRWRFYEKDGRILLLDAYATGTVDLLNANATVTGHGTTFVATHVDRKFTAGTSAGAAPEYRVLTYTSATQIKLSEPWGSATATGLSFSLYQDEYAMASDVYNVLRLWDESNQRPIPMMSALDMKTRAVYNRGTAPVLYAAPWRRTQSTDATDDAVYFRFWPVPTAAAILRYWYYRNPTDATGPASVLDVPTRLVPAVKKGVLAALKRYGKVEDWQVDQDVFNRMVEDEWRGDQPSTDFSVPMAKGGYHRGFVVFDLRVPTVTP